MGWQLEQDCIAAVLLVFYHQSTPPNLTLTLALTLTLTLNKQVSSISEAKKESIRRSQPSLTLALTLTLL